MRLAQSGVRPRQDNWHDGPAAARDRSCRSARVGDVPAIKRRRVPTVTSQLSAPQANFASHQQTSGSPEVSGPRPPVFLLPPPETLDRHNRITITGIKRPRSLPRQAAVSPGPARGRRQERSIARSQRRPEPEDLRAAAHAAGAAVKRVESAFGAFLSFSRSTLIVTARAVLSRAADRSVRCTSVMRVAT
jgi:hypothetical protein